MSISVTVIVLFVFVVVVVRFFYFATLLVGYFVVTFVTLSALYIGFCLPLCRVM